MKKDIEPTLAKNVDFTPAAPVAVGAVSGLVPLPEVPRESSAETIPQLFPGAVENAQ